MKTLVAILVALLFAHPVVGQSQTDIGALMERARTALNDLDYAEATKIATQLVALESESNRSEHITALQLLAAGYFPEEREAQQRDSAHVYLQRLVRLWPEATIPRDISWPGLTDLLEETRRTTFAIASTADSVQTVGIDGVIPFAITATQRAFFYLTISPHDGRDPFVVDSSGPSLRSTLRVPAVRADTAILRSGTYDFVIRASAEDGSDSQETRYRARVDATALNWDTGPGVFNDVLLLPERSKPNRRRNALIGVGLGAMTAVLANTFRASDPVSSTSADGRAYFIGGSIAIGGLLGAIFDRGAVLEENITANIRYQSDHAAAVAAANEHNNILRRQYSASVRLTGVWR